MDSAMAGRTTFIVAHRISTLQRADQIIVLNHGQIVQRGKHEELLVQKGMYRWMVSTQLADRESQRLLGLAGLALPEPGKTAS
jgi:ABC-type multidrug transport system fused ATPase/permease subunit